MEVWLDAYKNRGFIRYSIIDKNVNKAVGTMEIFGGEEAAETLADEFKNPNMFAGIYYGNENTDNDDGTSKVAAVRGFLESNDRVRKGKKMVKVTTIRNKMKNCLPVLFLAAFLMVIFLPNGIVMAQDGQEFDEIIWLNEGTKMDLGGGLSIEIKSHSKTARSSR